MWPRATVYPTDASAFQPLVPTQAGFVAGGGIVMQQHLVAHVFGLAQRPLAFGQRRAADRDVVSAKDSVNLKAGVGAGTVANDHDGVILAQIQALKGSDISNLIAVDRFQRADNVQVQRRFGNGESAQAGHQPAGGKRGWQHQSQAAMWVRYARHFNRCHKTFQAFTDLGQHGSALCGQFQ